MHSNTAHNSHAIMQAGVVIARSMILRITLDEVDHRGSTRKVIGEPARDADRFA